MAFNGRRDTRFRRFHGLASAIAASKGHHRRRTLSQFIAPGFDIIGFQAQIARMGFATKITKRPGRKDYRLLVAQ